MQDLNITRDRIRDPTGLRQLYGKLPSRSLKLIIDVERHDLCASTRCCQQEGLPVLILAPMSRSGNTVLEIIFIVMQICILSKIQRVRQESMFRNSKLFANFIKGEINAIL